MHKIEATPPNPSEKAADMIEVKPEECLVIEDAEAGINATVSRGFEMAHSLLILAHSYFLMIFEVSDCIYKVV